MVFVVGRSYILAYWKCTVRDIVVLSRWEDLSNQFIWFTWHLEFLCFGGLQMLTSCKLLVNSIRTFAHFLWISVYVKAFAIHYISAFGFHSRMLWKWLRNLNAVGLLFTFQEYGQYWFLIINEPFCGQVGWLFYPADSGYLLLWQFAKIAVLWKLWGKVAVLKTNYRYTRARQAIREGDGGAIAYQPERCHE